MDTISSIDTLGSKLKSVREAQGLLIENISRETRIARAILVSLEDDDISNLPPKIYVIGFVKTYARILKISEDECLLLLDKLYKPREVLDQQESENIILNSQKQETASHKRAAIYLIPVAVIAASILYFMISKPQQTPIKQKDNKQNDQAPTKNVKLVSQLVEKKQTSLSPEVQSPLPNKGAQKISSKQQSIKLEKSFQENKIPPTIEKQVPPTSSSADKLKKLKEQAEKPIHFISFPNKLYTVLPQSAEAALLTIPKKYLQQFNPDLQNLYIRSTHGASWITYQLNNEKIHKYILREGKEMFLQAKLIRMFVGNIHSIELYLNNIKIRTSSKTGVKSLVFPQERAQEFKIPLFIFQKNGSVISSQEYLQQQTSRQPIQASKEKSSN